MVAGQLSTGDDGRTRCWWCGTDPVYVAYHDDEWGRPVHDELHQFELLCLEGAQAGLSWITVLRKRDAYRRAFRNFEPEVVAGFGARDVRRLLADAGIIRNRQKIDAAIGNARALLTLHEAGETLTELMWSHAPKPRKKPVPVGGDIPATTPEAEALSKALKSRGFKFVGPTIVYAHMQSAGMVDDHLAGCFRAR